MAYGDNKNRRRGIREQPMIAEKVRKSLLSLGYSFESKNSSILEDMNNKIDHTFYFNETTPFFDRSIVSVDFKSGWTITTKNDIGQDTLEVSKSNYIVFYHQKKIHWFEKNVLKEWVNQNKHLIKNNTNGGKSKWIGVIGYCPYELKIPEIKTSLK